MKISRKHVVEEGECKCWSDTVKHDLSMFGNHFCSEGKRLPPDDVVIKSDGTYELVEDK